MRTSFIAALALALSGAAASAFAQTAGDAVHGQVLFKQKCSVCHSAGTNTTGSIGPKLDGVVGRKAGSLPGFSYSKALVGSGKVWSPAALDKFLTAPTKEVPGTMMAINVAAPQDRADIIAYFATLN